MTNEDLTKSVERLRSLKLPLKYNRLHQEITQSDNEVICKLYFHKDFTNDQTVRNHTGEAMVTMMNTILQTTVSIH